MPSKVKKSTRLTRKAGHGALSVEAIHASFEKMDNRLRRAVESGITDSELGRAVERAWSAAFHHELSAPATRGLVAHYRGLYGGSRAGRKTRKQRGGMAPLNWTTGPGVASTSFGRFPDDFSTSTQARHDLDLGRFFEDPVSRSCNATGGVDTLAKQSGGKQRGGGIFDALMAGHAPASVPRNSFETAISTLQAAPNTNPPADPSVRTWPFANPELNAFDSSKVSNLMGLSSVYQAR